MDKLEQLEARFKANPSDTKTAASILVHIHRNLHGLRRPDVVAPCGERVFFAATGGRPGSAAAYFNGDDALMWNILESVFLALLDVNKLDVAEKCLETLQKQFTSSLRVQRLEGLFFEAKGELDNAEDVYADILDQEPDEPFVLKRKIAIAKAQRKSKAAVNMLNDYLKLYAGDQDAWQELCDLYLSLLEHRKAAYCLEELILLEPYNYLNHNKYGEVMYTLGDFKTARKHFAMSLELTAEATEDGAQPQQQHQSATAGASNLRALYGIIAAAKAIQQQSSSAADSVNEQILAQAQQQLVKRYAQSKQMRTLADIVKHTITSA